MLWAGVLRAGVLGAAGLGLLVFVATDLLYGLVAALSETRAAQRLRVVSRDPASVRRVALIALRAVGRSYRERFYLRAEALTTPGEFD